MSEPAVAAPYRPDASDEDLVRLAQDGDVRACEALQLRHYDGVYALARRRLRNEALAKDAAGDVFADAFLNIGRFRGRSKFSTWLFRIAQNRITKHCARQARDRSIQAGVELDQLSDPALVPALGRSPEELHDLRQAYLEVIGAIQRLPAEEAAVLNLRFLADLGVDEVAQVLGISEDAVYHRVARGREKLRAALRVRKKDG
jgi:RNA polymerase sigma-70 factor (ECF subfamily)